MKVVRILLSPFYFIFLVFCIIIIPIGIILFFGGICDILGKYLKEEKVDKEDFIMAFSILTLPYHETINFINNYK